MPIALLWIVFVLVIVGLLLWALTQFPIDATIAKLIRVVVIVVAAIYVLYTLFNLLSGMAGHMAR